MNDPILAQQWFSHVLEQRVYQDVVLYTHGWLTAPTALSVAIHQINRSL